LSNCEQNTYHFVKFGFASFLLEHRQSIKLRPFVLAEERYINARYNFTNDDVRRDHVSVHEGGNPGVERPAVREPRRDAGTLQPGEAQHVPGMLKMPRYSSCQSFTS
jgi:hypothetical protein